jgi:hypothetical protein
MKKRRQFMETICKHQECQSQATVECIFVGRAPHYKIQTINYCPDHAKENGYCSICGEPHKGAYSGLCFDCWVNKNYYGRS